MYEVHITKEKQASSNRTTSKKIILSHLKQIKLKKIMNSLICKNTPKKKTTFMCNGIKKKGNFFTPSKSLLLLKLNLKIDFVSIL